MTPALRTAVGFLSVFTFVFAGSAWSQANPDVEAPQGMIFSVPSTSNNNDTGTIDCSATNGGLPCSGFSTFTDDIYLEVIEFDIDGTIVGFDANNDQIIAGQASKVIDEDTTGSVNAEYGDDDDNSDGDNDPFSKSNNAGANQESTDPAIRDPAIQEAFDNLSVSEGIDGEGPGFTLRFSFEQGVKDSDAGPDDQPELIFSERGLNSDTRIELIIGGTFENPVKTDPLVIDRGQMVDSGVSIDSTEVSGGQNLGVVGIDLSEFSGGGFNPATDTVFGMDFGSAAGGADIFGGVAALCEDNCEPNIFNPVAEYRMEESAWNGTSGEVTDETGNNNGTAPNGATTSITAPDPADPRDPGTCRYGEFDGSNHFVRIPHSPGLEMSDNDSVTVTAWVRKESAQSGFIAIAQKSDTSYNLQLNNGNEPEFAIHDGGFNVASAGFSLNNDQWYHLAGTYDGNEVKIYVDGTLEDTTTASGTMTDASSFDVGIGENLDNTGRHFHGQLDEVRIYDSALPQGSVEKVRDATHPCPTGPFCPAGAELSDTFEDDTLTDVWNVQQGGNDAGVSDVFSDDGDRSVFLRGNGVRVVSPKIDLSSADSASLSFWVKRGEDIGDRSLSERPEGGEDLRLEYFSNATNGWELLMEGGDTAEYPGGSPGGEVFDGADTTFSLPADARHADSQIRFVHTGGANGEWDYWHIDSICLTATSGVDHYAISHSGPGVTCLATDVTITAHDSADNPVDPGTVTLDLSTTTGKGDWATVSSGSGTLSNVGGTGNGQAEYEFPGGESSVILALNYTDIGAGNSETFNIDVDDGSATDKRDNTDPEDPDLTFALTGFRFANIDDGNTTIPTQLSGKPSDTGYNSRTLALQAIRASPIDPSQCNAAFPDGSDRDIEVAAECRNPTTCAGKQVEIRNNGNDPLVPTNNDNGGTGTNFSGTIPLRFTDDGSGVSQAEFALHYADAGLMQLHARYNIPLDDGTPSGDFMTGSSNDFVVRPFAFDVMVPDDTGATGEAGTVMKQAGEAFETTLRAVRWESGEDDNADGRPDAMDNISDNIVTPNFGQEDTPPGEETALVTPALADPASGSDGDLSNAEFDAFGDGTNAAGTDTVGNMRWDEVGYVDLRAELDGNDYLGSGEDITGVAEMVGRFIPARFTLSAPSLTDRAAQTCAGSSPFTYIGERFDTDFTLTAEATADVGSTVTQNYEGAFARLNSGGETNPGGIDQDDIDRSPSLNIDDATINWSAGQGTIGLELRFERDGREGPYTPLRVGVAPEDKDNVTLAVSNRNLDVDADGADDHGQTGEVTLRFGRLRLDDAFGPEIAPVVQPWQIEYWTGTTWARNTADDCTVLTLVNNVELDPDANSGSGNEVDGTQAVDLSSGDGQTEIDNAIDVVAEEIVFMMGRADVQYAASGAGNRGWIESRSELAPNFAYLRSDIDDDGQFQESPGARVTFGIFAGEREHIYLREVFPAP